MRWIGKSIRLCYGFGMGNNDGKYAAIENGSDADKG